MSKELLHNLLKVLFTVAGASVLIWVSFSLISTAEVLDKEKEKKPIHRILTFGCFIGEEQSTALITHTRSKFHPRSATWELHGPNVEMLVYSQRPGEMCLIRDIPVVIKPEKK